MQQNARAMRNVADLTVDRDQKAQEHGACSQNLQQHLRIEQQLNRRVTELRETVETAQRNLTFVRSRMTKCQAGVSWYAQRVRDLSAEVTSRLSRSEYQATFDKLRNQRSIALYAAQTCREEKANITIEAAECSTALEESETRLVESNETCWRAKELEIAALNAQLQSKIALHARF